MSSSFYENRILPHLINLACSTRPTRKQREKIVPLATGEVLEVGFGSGLNLPFYDVNKVTKIWGLEPSEGMRQKAQSQLNKSPLDVELVELPGEQIPLQNNSIDTVVVTYTLCTIPDVNMALEGMCRVLKPGGRLLYCEHGKAPDHSVHRWQERLNPAWKRVSGGCHMNRDIPCLLHAGGFKIENDERMYIPGPRVFAYNYWGTAKAAQ